MGRKVNWRLEEHEEVSGGGAGISFAILSALTGSAGLVSFEAITAFLIYFVKSSTSYER